ncbi:MAG TPA: ribonuclease R [Planctomycetaceae bacterium]|nr:ribonuclease R [Planctomycetaceae bacterium]
MSDAQNLTFDDQILAVVNAVEYRPVTQSILAKSLGIKKKALRDFGDALARLIEAGKLRQDKQGRIRVCGSSGLVSGVLRKISSGAAFVIPTEKPKGEKAGDIYVSARDCRDAQTGDDVMVRITAKRRAAGQRCGVIEKVLERATSVFVGTYFESGDQGFVRVDGTVFGSAIHVGDPGAKGARIDDKVVIEMLRFPTADRKGEAVLTEVLGHRGDPGVDTMSVVHSMGLPYEFSEAVHDDARRQADAFDETNLKGREDLSAETIITIDPVDARDFDDAISLKRSDNGHWHLGVHIADVAHFVTPGGKLDAEARKRGTSVYLPGHVIPMLPELISNGLASLQQGQVRFTKTAFIEFDETGTVVGSDVANSAIRVTRRFAYEDVMPILHNSRKSFANVTPEVRKLLQDMFELAMLLRRRRFASGALQMGIPEVAIDFDKEGAVSGAHQRHHDESHEIIEEFMLAANVAVATILSTRGLPFLRRVHADPDEIKMRNFQQFCQGLGLTLQKAQDRFEIQQLIHKVEGKPEQRAVNFALLRSMKQAVYSPDDMGHYALSEEDYCHFTSPIRRYPDLTIHRLIGQIAAKRAATPQPVPELIELGKHCSLTERRAEKAERELIRVKMLRYMAQRVGEEMDSIITGVESFGLFCQGIEIPAEGMIHLSALSDDFYVFDQATRRLTGSKTHREFRLGDPIRIVIAAVDIDRRQLDMRVADSSPTSRRKKVRPPSEREHQSAVHPSAKKQQEFPKQGKRRGDKKGSGTVKKSKRGRKRS